MDLVFRPLFCKLCGECRHHGQTLNNHGSQSPFVFQWVEKQGLSQLWNGDNHISFY